MSATEVSNMAYGLLADSIMRGRPVPLQLINDLTDDLISESDLDPTGRCGCYRDEFGVTQPCPWCEERSWQEQEDGEPRKPLDPGDPGYAQMFPTERPATYDGVWRVQP